jgi:hypothetical protein
MKMRVAPENPLWEALVDIRRELDAGLRRSVDSEFCCRRRNL